MPMRRTFTANLQDYCFSGGSSACLADLAALADAADDVPVTEYGALSAKAAERMDDEATKTLPGLVRREGSSSFLTSVLNVTKSLIGIGMLTLPRALADSTPVVGAGLLLLCGGLAALSFFMLGYCAHLTGAETLPQLWDATVGKRSSFLVETVIFVDTLLSCTAFTLLLGNYASKSLSGLFPTLPEAVTCHKTLVVIVGVGLLLPLCMIRRLSLLRFSSIAGLLCTLYVFFYVVGDYSIVGGEAPLDNEIEVGNVLRSTAIFVVAFMAHFNAPAFYADLKDRSPSRFAAVSAASFGAAFLVYFAFGLSGLCRFGEAVPGNALAAYPLSRPVLLMWLGMSLCVVSSFPLVFAALRTAALRLAGRMGGGALDLDGQASSKATVVLVLAITCVGARLEDLSAVVSLCGALSGICLALLFPGAVMLALPKRKTPRFKILAKALLGCGVITGAATSIVVLRRDILGL